MRSGLTFRINNHIFAYSREYGNMNKTIRNLKALSEPGRLRVLFLLYSAGELCVCEIEQVLGMSASTASRNLRELETTGWLKSRREGRWIHYRLADLDSDWMSILNPIVAVFSKTAEAKYDLDRRHKILTEDHKTCIDHSASLETFYEQVDRG
jgi:DNA-binding transcriptional ArsR family regulator